MGLDLNSMRVYALGLAHRAVNDIRQDGFRQLRNYVDMCAFLAKSDSQKAFFDKAQLALEKTNSLYYPLIQRTLDTVSPDVICTVGVNLGIDALIYGGGQLKKVAQETGQPVSWITVADADAPDLQPIVAKGEAAGQFLWVLLYTDGAFDAAQSLAATHPKSDFALLMPPEQITKERAARLADTPNLVPMLQLEQPEFSEEIHAAVALLRTQKLFYGIYVSLTDETAEMATSAEWLDILAQHSLLCLYSHRRVSAEKAADLVQSIYACRTTTGSPVLLLDWEADTNSIGSFISPLAQVERRTSKNA